MEQFLKNINKPPSQEYLQEQKVADEEQAAISKKWPLATCKQKALAMTNTVPKKYISESNGSALEEEQAQVAFLAMEMQLIQDFKRVADSSWTAPIELSAKLNKFIIPDHNFFNSQPIAASLEGYQTDMNNNQELHLFSDYQHWTQHKAKAARLNFPSVIYPDVLPTTGIVSSALSPAAHSICKPWMLWTKTPICTMGITSHKR